MKKVLIANRGEIAVRVIRACREAGLKTVAVYSEADRTSRHVALADESVCIGPALSRDSYLNQEALLAAAKITGAEAVHPGYGFLAENASFAKNCFRWGVTFIGPSPEAMEALGNKARAREFATKVGVPVVPGTKLLEPKDAEKAAAAIGFPVLIKAAAGGGGRGIRVVRERGQFARELEMAQSEAKAAFGDGSVFVEKLIDKPRHIEIQIICDTKGNRVAFPERDCSVQRRRQKLIEESPSPAVTPKIRKELQEAALTLAEASGYTNAGTVEFLMDQNGKFYFIEVNTRLQVEHPVTETVTDLDLVRAQLRVAAGQALDIDPKEAANPICHAIEHRINAEDPSRDFAPSPGTVNEWVVPGGPGVRVDTHLYPGYTVPPNYDSLVAKLICFGHDRGAALDCADRALSEFTISGIETTIPFHRKVLAHPAFRAGDVHTGFIEEMNA